MHLGSKAAPKDDVYAKRVYQRIISLAIVTHITYIFLFGLLACPPLAFYNGASTAFYLLMLVMVRRGAFRAAVTAIHSEVCLFVAVGVLAVGNEAGLALLLIAMASLVYFCPFAHKYVPYLFSAAEIALFYALKFYMDGRAPRLAALQPGALHGLYAYNAAVCFGIILYAAFASDLSATVSRRKLQQENLTLEAIANHDQLTGLLSRRPFLAAAGQGGLEGAYVAMGDIDDFKGINDTYGHVCGDYILRTVAQLMKSHCPHAAVCRWGGEEFVFLFREEEAAVLGQIEALRGAIAAYPFVYDRFQIRVTATFGLARGAEAPQLPQLIALADERMYQGKRRGKNQVVAR